jgi:myo-inositol-1(or 4)-monophosphatase
MKLLPAAGLCRLADESMVAPAIGKRFDLACELARDCGDLALAARRGAAFTVRAKGPQDFVTDVDLRIESTIRSRVAVEFPTDSVLGEEGGLSLRQGDITWLVDPIDGTANFIHGLGHWSVSIAGLAEGELVFGVVYDPTREETFTALAGSGAACGGAPLRVAGVAALAEATIGVGYCTGFPPARHAACIAGLIEAGASYRDPGSAALSLAYVAAGRLDGYVEAGITAWDIGAGVLIVREGGGFTTPIPAGEALARPTAVVAAAPGIADALRGCVRRAWVEPDQAGSPVPDWLRATAL